MIYETSPYAFAFVTVMIGGATAFMAGRAVAKGWRPFWQALIYAAMLGAVVRFLHWGLFAGATIDSWRAVQGTLVAPYYYAVDTAFLIGFAALGFRLQRVSQMTRQYGWLYEKTSAFTVRRKPGQNPVAEPAKTR